MRISEDEKIVLKALMREAADEANKPIIDKLDAVQEETRNHRQTLYGPEGNNGLNGDMKSMKKTIEQYRSDRRVVIAAASAVSAMVSAGALFIKSLFKGS